MLMEHRAGAPSVSYLLIVLLALFPGCVQKPKHHFDTVESLLGAYEPPDVDEGFIPIPEELLDFELPKKKPYRLGIGDVVLVKVLHTSPVPGYAKGVEAEVMEDGDIRLPAIGHIEAEGKTAEARTMYERALEINPDFAPAANNLAWMLLQENEDLDRALELAKRAKKQLPDDPNVADTLGLAFLAKGFYPSAISELSDAAEKMPEHPTVLYHLGLAHWKNGDKQEAQAALDKALKIKLDFPEKKKAEKLLEEIRTERT